jgi:hypothetical protein
VLQALDEAQVHLASWCPLPDERPAVRERAEDHAVIGIAADQQRTDADRRGRSQERDPRPAGAAAAVEPIRRCSDTECVMPSQACDAVT